MSGIVVVGSQWGDEGKGKITDYLAQKADVVVLKVEIMLVIQLNLMVRSLL